MIWISGSKKSVVVVLSLVAFTTIAAAQITGGGYYGDGAGSITGTDAGFSIPQYESHEQIFFELAVPFILVSSLLHLIMAKILHGILRDKEQPGGYVTPAGITMVNDSPNVRKYSMLMSITITATLVPTIFWDYIVRMIRGIGILVVTAFALMLFFIMYLMVKKPQPEEND